MCEDTLGAGILSMIDQLASTNKNEAGEHPYRGKPDHPGPKTKSVQYPEKSRYYTGITDSSRGEMSRHVLSC